MMQRAEDEYSVERRKKTERERERRKGAAERIADSRWYGSGHDERGTGSLMVNVNVKLNGELGGFSAGRTIVVVVVIVVVL